MKSRFTAAVGAGAPPAGARHAQAEAASSARAAVADSGKSLAHLLCYRYDHTHTASVQFTLVCLESLCGQTIALP
jgi:hypothetical protein